jgi:hypothetical protein
MAEDQVLTSKDVATILKLTVIVDVDPAGGIAMLEAEETKITPRKLRHPKDLSVKRGAAHDAW